MTGCDHPHSPAHPTPPPCCTSGARPGPACRPQRSAALSQVVTELCGQVPALAMDHGRCYEGLPSRAVIVQLVEELRSVLFPGYHGNSELTADNVLFHVGATLDRAQRALRQQVKRGYCFTCCGGSHCGNCDTDAARTTDAFLERLPAIRRLLLTDVQAAYTGDPAAVSPDETIFCYPGLTAIISHRIAHELYRLGVPLIPRIISEHAHSLTGIDIHPGATIADHFFIDHGTGVVIGETAVIGSRVRIYQGVTLGAKSFPLDDQGRPLKGLPRHPIVEDDVIIYAGATILGRITIGRGSVIGGSVSLTRSVAAGSKVTQAAAYQERFEGGEGI